MKTNFILCFSLFLTILSLGLLFSCKSSVNHTNIKNKAWQSLEGASKNSVIISGHRGGRGEGMPENSLHTFQKVTSIMPVFFEIDPRLTKDSVIVLMHDETLDRTTNGTGKLINYTWEEVRKLRLKDLPGNITEDTIPTLEEAIRWSKGKAILNLDRKDVPREMIVDIIKKCKAEEYVMLTVHTGEQARYYYDRMPRIMFSAFARNIKEYEDMASSGVPWENMIAYVGHTIDDKNRPIVEMLREKGVKCMISVAPTHDRLGSPEERQEGYLQEIQKQPDIIESDYPIEVWKALEK